MILQIDENAEEIYFPDPHYGDDDGCFAIGGDLEYRPPAAGLQQWHLSLV